VYPYVGDFAISEFCGKYGYLDKKGKVIIKPVFDNVGNFHDGLAKVQINKNWGYIDGSGNIVINKDILKAPTDIQTSEPLSNVSDFSEGFAIVTVRKNTQYIDKSGINPFPLKFETVKPFKNGIARVKLTDRRGWNFIDKKGKILFTTFL
jgi:hypothetical protein